MLSRLLRQSLAILVLALFPALVSGAWQLRWSTPEPLADGEVRVATVISWGDTVQWIDARSRADFEQAHIPGALLLNEDEWNKLVPKFLDDWDPDKAIVVYCDGGTCEASHRVADRMREELQIGNVHVLKGGFPAWQQK